MLTIEKIENGFIVRIEQELGPDYLPRESDTPKSSMVMGTVLPPEKIWYAKNMEDVFDIQKKHYFNL